MTKAATSIRVKVFRSQSGSEGKFEDFQIKTSEPISVMALLAKIHETDMTFACRTSTCFKGQCGSCLVRVNGKDVFGCITLVKPGESVVIEPYSKFAVIRDVVVDFSHPVSEGKDVGKL